MSESTRDKADRRFQFKLSALSVTAIALISLLPLLVFAGIAGGIVAMVLAMRPSEPVATVALNANTPGTLEWTEGAYSQELWLEVDLSHHFEQPWLGGEILLDGHPYPVSFSGNAVLQGSSSSFKVGWVQVGDQASGELRIMELTPGGEGSEHSATMLFEPGPATTTRVLRVHVVNCDNWGCDPDRLL